MHPRYSRVMGKVPGCNHRIWLVTTGLAGAVRMTTDS